MTESSGGCDAHEVEVHAEVLGGVGTWHLDLRTRAFSTNLAARGLFGWPADGPSPTLEQYLACVHPDDAARVTASADGLVRHGVEYVLEHRAVLPGGRLAYLRAVACASRDEAGRTVCLHGICLDVTDLQHAAAEAERARARARAVLDTLHDGYLLTSGGVILEANAAMCRITGFAQDQLEGAGTPYPFWVPGQEEQLLAVRAGLAERGGGAAEIDARHADGRRLRLALTATVLPTEEGLTLWAVLVRDVTDERARERRLETEAHTDALTGLPNSRTFREALTSAVTAAGSQPLSLSVLDLDRFKLVNDSHGHAVGDHVLVEAARRLSAATGDGCVLARIGGEEFAVLLPGRTEPEAREVMLRALAALRSAPFAIAGTVTASAGVAQLRDGMDDDALFRLADTRLYAAKDGGRDQVR